MLEILYPVSPFDIQHIRDFFTTFVEWGRTRYGDKSYLVDNYFDKDAFEAELRDLPGEYLRPIGNLLLAKFDGQPAGCVAMRRLDDETCEMKRMFVASQFRQQGVGRALAKQLMTDAKHAGYSCMRLESGLPQFEAIRLYRSLGFKEIEPPYEIPEEWVGIAVFMSSLL